MLHGIGGCTVEEAKETLSHAEFVSWCDYIAKRGTLNVGTRIEIGFAMLAQVTTAMHGRRTRIEDFMPDRNAKPVGSIGDVMKLLRGARKANGNT